MGKRKRPFQIEDIDYIYPYLPQILKTRSGDKQFLNRRYCLTTNGEAETTVSNRRYWFDLPVFARFTWRALSVVGKCHGSDTQEACILASSPPGRPMLLLDTPPLLRLEDIKLVHVKTSLKLSKLSFIDITYGCQLLSRSINKDLEPPGPTQLGKHAGSTMSVYRAFGLWPIAQHGSALLLTHPSPRRTI